jgi:hypothetical protein
MSSKVWIVMSDRQGLARNTSKKLAYEYTAEDTGVDFVKPIGLVFDHGDGGNIHMSDSPAVHVAANPIISTVEVSNLEGRLLTLVDAAFSDIEQRKAFKSVIRETVWRWNGDNERRVRESFDFLAQ